MFHMYILSALNIYIIFIYIEISNEYTKHHISSAVFIKSITF